MKYVCFFRIPIVLNFGTYVNKFRYVCKVIYIGNKNYLDTYVKYSRGKLLITFVLCVIFLVWESEISMQRYRSDLKAREQNTLSIVVKRT